MKEYIREESNLLTDARIAKVLFPPTGAVKISHENYPPALATDYLRTARTREDLVRRLFTESGEWQFSPDQVNLYELSPSHVLEYMLAVTKPIYEAAQQSLGEVNWFGYNDHSTNHIRPVATRTLIFLQEAGCDMDTQRRGVIAAVGHDLGNLINRDIHSLISPLMLAKIFPRLMEDPEQWRTVRRAMEFHDGEVYNKFMEQVGMLPAEDRLRKMKEAFGYEGLALVAADKIDVGRHRVNDKALSLGAIDVHAPSQMNLALETVSAMDDQQIFNWQISFVPEVRPYELERFQRLAFPDKRYSSGYRMYASDRVRIGDAPEANYELTRNLFLRKDMGRNKMAIQAIFALMPHIQKFHMHFSNSTNGKHLDDFSFSRAKLDQDLKIFSDTFK